MSTFDKIFTLLYKCFGAFRRLVFHPMQYGRDMLLSIPNVMITIIYFFLLFFPLAWRCP